MLDLLHPLHLVIKCNNKWLNDEELENYLQDYAVVVSIENKNHPNLYNQIKLQNKLKIRI